MRNIQVEYSPIKPRCSYKVFSYQNAYWGTFHVLTQFFFTACRTELDYYHHKATTEVALRVDQRLET